MTWQEHLNLQPAGRDLPQEVIQVAGQSAPADVGQLAKQLSMPQEFVNELLSMIEEKKQIVLTGPPGTGKTFVAKALARHLTGNSEQRWQLIQLHPSYSYEDFVEGFRPYLDTNDQLSYEVRPGVLRRIASQALEAATSTPDGTPIPDFVIILDEINRANLSRVFGELFYSLEYRGEPVTLQYADDDGPAFQLPKNLIFIGTMNNADRSIATFDAALRRRFYFVDFAVDEPPIVGVLSRYLEETSQTGFGWLVPFLEAVNGFVPEPDYAVGPSYFLQPGLTDKGIERIWDHAIRPYLVDRFPDLREEVGFDYATLKFNAGLIPADGLGEHDKTEHEPAPLATPATDEA